MLKHLTFKAFTEITKTATITVDQHGGRAKCLQRLIRLDMPVPTTVALSFETVRQIAQGKMTDVEAILDFFGDTPLVSVRPSAEGADWGGPGAILNIGMNERRHAVMVQRRGEDAANAIYLRFIHTYAVQVAHLDADLFPPVQRPARSDVAEALRIYEIETDEPFPEEPAEQLAGVLRSMARAWEGTSARLLRKARGAPEDAGLGLVVQRMSLGVGNDESGSGVMQFINSTTGKAQITGRYMSQSQGRDALALKHAAIFLTRDPRGPSLEELAPEIFDQLVGLGELARSKLREEMQIEFVIQDSVLSVIDAVRVARTARANVEIVVGLAQDRIITRDEALLRVPPRSLNELMHWQVNPEAERNALLRGIAASPGAAVGKLVFSSTRAQALAAQGEACILAKRETSPDDVRGMHAAKGVLTAKGGMSSHAAVIARGLGVPCVVGAGQIIIDRRARHMRLPDGRIFEEGALVTLDGSAGEVLDGAADMLEPALGEAFQTLLGWADAVRDIGVRVNADTPEDARIARTFKAEGIGLCRTEHMFFDDDRLTVMREMIFADAPEDRADALRQLLPMQREDFTRLFEIMEGLPVCIRLFDPPLHEFLPADRQGVVDLANALGRPVSDVQARIDSMTEFNPMLGLRGVRLGITVPEIYEMQVQAIFEAVIALADAGTEVVPEIMLPLVSAQREVEILQSRIEQVAAKVRAERTAAFSYKLGVMVETPRAALKAHNIAELCSFMSFGTNDLTQMTYGLSRDDAGRFMQTYVQQGVFKEDPFHYLDKEGVGELLQIGAQRGRKANPRIVLSICGEHGGTADSIAFARECGFNYVSCSPFRVPVARLAGAHAVLTRR
ncbi:putative PEP-binding protein [Mangrovicoccus sp. HB161399]|uniref:putative PEP-binding protein n=1 Tax=Mangrovicoccus sp. HB161399 TaxID=2720392 RepID=UPI00155210D5